MDTSAMSRRLQALLDEEESLEIQVFAHRSRMTVAQWVRQALRRARRDHSATAEAKLAAVPEATSREFPAAGIEVRLGEIGPGRNPS